MTCYDLNVLILMLRFSPKGAFLSGIDTHIPADHVFKFLFVNVVLQSCEYSTQQETLMVKQAATLEEIKALTNQVQTDLLFVTFACCCMRHHLLYFLSHKKTHLKFFFSSRCEIGTQMYTSCTDLLIDNTDDPSSACCYMTHLV